MKLIQETYVTQTTWTPLFFRAQPKLRPENKQNGESWPKTETKNKEIVPKPLGREKHMRGTLITQPAQKQTQKEE